MRAAPALLLAAALAAGVAPAARAQHAADSAAELSTLAGVYSDAQARRGESTYRKQCNGCHSPDLHSGPIFRRVWSGKSVYELWDLVRSTMPNDAPGSLKVEEYTDIIAYLLRLNGNPPGAQALPSDPAQLRRIRIAPAPAPGG